MQTTALTIPVLEARQAELHARAARVRRARRGWSKPEPAPSGTAPGCTLVPHPRAA
jgi:hypothetical protein